MANLATINNNLLADSGIDPLSVVLGSGTANQIAYWIDADNIGALTTATYPSLTELSYVKGVTSAIQTQIDAKLSLSGGTMTGNINWLQSDRGLVWSFDTDSAYIKFYSTGDGDSNTRLEFATTDNNDEYFRWVHIPSGGTIYELMRLKAVASGKSELIISGRLGIGVTPNANWLTSLNVLQIGYGASIFTTNSSSASLIRVNTNTYEDAGGQKYLYNDFATSYRQFQGEHQWFTSVSGTANTAISFLQGMTLKATRQLQLNAYGSGTFTGTRAYDLAIDSSGNIIEVAVGAGTVTGSGTANEISYWTGSSSIGSLSTATYPSLTELSYVKGVTSAIQTQLNGKLNLSGGTMTGQLIVAYDTVAEPYVNAIFRGTTSANLGGILVNGLNQSHVRFQVGSTTWDGAGSKQWQIRLGAGDGTDILRIYSWTYGNDVASFLSTGVVRLNYYTTNGFVKFSSSNGTLAVDTTSYQPLLTNPVTGTGTNNYIPKFTTTGSTIGDSAILDNGTSVEMTGRDLRVISAADPQIYLTKTGTGAGSWRILGSTGTSLFRFRIYDDVAGADRFDIFSNGNVSIGETTDQGVKFYVNGTGYFNGALVANGRINASRYGNTPGGSILMGVENNSTEKWSYLSSTQYNSTTYPQGASVIGMYATETENRVVIGGSIYECNPATSIEFYTYTSVSHATGGLRRMQITKEGTIIFNAYTTDGILKVSSSNGTVALAVAGTDYVAPSALSGYLPLTGGTLTGQLISSYSISIEPYVNAIFRNTNTTANQAYGGILVSGLKQSHVRFQVGSATWDGTGSKQWQLRAGYGAANDEMGLYSWTKGDDVITWFSSGNVSIGNRSDAYKLDVTGTGNYNSDGVPLTLQGGGRILYFNVKASPTTGNTGVTLRTDSGSYISLATGANPTRTGVVVDFNNNLAIQALPNASWGTSTKALQINDTGAVYDDGNSNTIMANNSYYNGTVNKKFISGFSSRIIFQKASRATYFQTAATGAADDTITYTDDLILNNTSASFIGDIRITNNEPQIYLTKTGTGAGTWRILGSTGGDTFRFRIYDEVASADRFDIFSNGNVSIGTTTDNGYKLYVNGSFYANGTGTFANKLASYSPGGGVDAAVFYDRTGAAGVSVDQYGTLNAYSNIVNIAGIYASGSSGTPLIFKAGAVEQFRASATNMTVAGSLTASGRIHASRAGNLSGGSFLMGVENDSTGKWSYLVSTQYNSSSNPTGFSVIGGYTTATENKITIGGAIYECNPATSIEFYTYTAVTHATGGILRARITNDGYFYADTLRIKGGDTANTIYAGSSNMAITAESGYNISIGRVSDTTKSLNVNTTTGNVGMGVTSLSSWNTSAKVIQFDSTKYTSLASIGTDGHFNYNAYYDNVGWKSVGDGPASNMGMWSGNINFRVSNGSLAAANTAISWITPLQIGNNGLITCELNSQPVVVNGLYVNILLKTDSVNNYQRIRFDVGNQPYWGLTREATSNNFMIAGYVGSAWSDNVFKIFQTSGNVSIGSGTDGGKRLQVSGNLGLGGASSYNWLVANHNDDNWGFGMYNASSDYYPSVYLASDSSSHSTRGFRVRNVSTSTNIFVVQGQGNGTFAGSSTATSFFESSDMRLKELIEDNYRAIGVESIKPKLYKKNGIVEVGYYAQDFESILPSAISIGKDDMLNLSYTSVHTVKIAYLEDSIDEIKAKILYLENQLKQIQNENN